MGCQSGRLPARPVVAAAAPTIFQATTREDVAFQGPAAGERTSIREFFRRTSSRSLGPKAAECAQLYYPMCLLSWDVLHGLARMVAHQELLRGGQLVEWTATMQGRVIFVSHEWLGYHHPDPAGEQLSVLQRSLKHLASGTVSVGPDIAQQFQSRDREVVEGPRWAAALPLCFFWLDFAGVPQVSAEEAPQAPSGSTGRSASGSPSGSDHRFEGGVRAQLTMMRAVNSIPAYVERSAMVFVLTPVLKHHDDPGRVCNFSSWRNRGWCRMELCAALLSRSTVRIVKCVGDRADFMFISGRDVASLPPGQGSFTCCALGHVVSGRTIRCDKTRVHAVIDSMLEAAADHLGHLGQVELQRYFRCRHQAFLHGLPSGIPIRTAGLTPQSSWEEVGSMLEGFQASLGWRPQDDEAARLGRGWSCLHWAAFAGNALAVEALLAQGGHNIRAPTPYGFADLGLREGYPPLHLAVLTVDGSFGAAAALLDARADPTARAKNNYHLDALMFACLYGNVEVVRCWLSRFPSWDLERRDSFFGYTAATWAIVNRSTCGMLAEILCRRADPHAGSGYAPADSALFAAAQIGSREAAGLLVEASCSPEVRAQPPWRRWRAVCFAARQAMQLHLFCGSRCGPLLAFVANLGGATALHLAAKEGDVATLRALLAARADPACRNALGWTPLDWAQYQFGGRAPTLVTELLKAPAFDDASVGGQASNRDEFIVAVFATSI